MIVFGFIAIFIDEKNVQFFQNKDLIRFDNIFLTNIFQDLTIFKLGLRSIMTVSGAQRQGQLTGRHPSNIHPQNIWGLRQLTQVWVYGGSTYSVVHGRIAHKWCFSTSKIPTNRHVPNIIWTLKSSLSTEKWSDITNRPRILRAIIYTRKPVRAVCSHMNYYMHYKARTVVNVPCWFSFFIAS